MQHRLVAVAPLLACALLLHLGFACRPPLAPAVQGLVATHARASVDAPTPTHAPISTHPPVSTHAPASTHAPTPTDTPTPEPRTAVTAPATRTGAAPRQVRADLAPVPARASLAPVHARADRVRFAAYLDVTALAARTGRSPQGTVGASFDGRAYGSVTRPGRGNPTTDRRDPVEQETSTPPDVSYRRDNAADGRPLTADAAPDPIRLSILRC
ncbi:hypothetical protein ACH4OY_22960 [Micromonospora rubida]|uniref:Uncharacterized protein n=1 Tax=Micromonospora rubida TaxID=2697657 RepID=A0ABW7SPA4_9ACTN